MSYESLTRRVDRKTVYISSKKRTTGTPEDFVIEDTAQNFTTEPQSVKAVTATIPFTWSNVMLGVNNAFSFTGSVSGLHNFAIPAQNYDATTLAAALQAAITTAAPGQTYTVVYNSSMYQFTFASTTETFSIDFTIPNNMAALLGFPVAVTPVAASHTSSQAPNLTIDTEIWICSSLISGCDNGVIPWSDQPPDTERHDVLASVPIIGCPRTYFQYHAHLELPFYTILNSEFSNTGHSVPRPTRFQLVFPSGFPVDLNGFDWSMQIVFDFNK